MSLSNFEKKENVKNTTLKSVVKNAHAKLMHFWLNALGYHFCFSEYEHMQVF